MPNIRLFFYIQWQEKVSELTILHCVFIGASHYLKLSPLCSHILSSCLRPAHVRHEQNMQRKTGGGRKRGDSF